jgi:replicative DNA helicase
MTAEVFALPVRPQQRGIELERRVLGACLHLGLDFGAFEALGLTDADFADATCQVGWKIARALAGRKEPVNAATVGASGGRARLLTEADAETLQQLELGNLVDRPTLRRIARDLHLERQADRTARSLEAEVQRLRGGLFDPSRTAGVLSGIERQLHAESAAITDLTEDQLRILDRWDANLRAGIAEYVPTGIKVLDDAIGGLPRDFGVFVADAGVGKTAIVDSMIHSMLVLHPTLTLGLISPEDGVEHVPERWLARELGFLLRDIGSRKMTPDEEQRRGEICERNNALLARVLGYRERNITVDKLLALCWQLKDLGAGGIFIDNFNKISLREDSRRDFHERVQAFSDRMQEFAQKARIPTILLVHSTGDEVNQHGKISASSGMQGGKSIGRDVRFRLDLWRKDNELRATISKGNKLAEQGTVIQFARQATAGLIDPDSGEKVDPNAERAAEKRARGYNADDEREERRKRIKAKREAEKAKAEAEKMRPVEPEPQKELQLMANQP